MVDKNRKTVDDFYIITLMRTSLTNRQKRKLILLIVLLVVLLVVAACPDWWKKLESGQPGLYTVVEVNDGDTIVVDMNGRRETIRMIGVDTPETHRPETPVQCFGPQASTYTKNLLSGVKVRLSADPLNTNRDRYDRLLRYVYLPDGQLVQSDLIRKGYGFSYTQFPFGRAIEFDRYERQAKDSKMGLWSACQVIIDSSGREQTNPAD